MNESDLELYGIVGRMFKEIREEKNLSLATVSEYLQIAPISLQRYECGKRKIKIGTIKDLCDFYKISYDAFITEAKIRFGKNINAPTYYSCPECGFSYLTDSTSDIEDHIQRHQAWCNATNKFGKLYCYSPENETIKAQNRNIRNNMAYPLNERYNAELNVLRCLFSRSIESNGFDLNHVPFEQYVAMMLNTEKYRKRLGNELCQKLIANYGTLDGIKNGESIYHVPKSPEYAPNKNVINYESQEKIIVYYNQLNNTGKEAATEQVRLLTLDEKYTKITSAIKEPESDYLVPNAAHERTDIKVKEEERLDDENMID